MRDNLANLEFLNLSRTLRLVAQLRPYFGGCATPARSVVFNPGSSGFWTPADSIVFPVPSPSVALADASSVHSPVSRQASPSPTLEQFRLIPPIAVEAARPSPACPALDCSQR